MSKMDKSKFQLEFEMRSVPVALLWNYISSINGLTEWFADEVSISGKTYTFSWDGQSQTAQLLSMRTEVSIRFRWSDDNSRCYFEMKISVNELTDETILTVTDFALEDEIEDAKELWTAQVDTLRRALGC